MIDLAAAVAHNRKFLGLGALPDRTEARIAKLIEAWQEAHGLDPDGAYDRATEESLNTALVGEDGFAPPAVEAPPRSVQIWPPWQSPTDYIWGTPGPPGSAWAKANIVDCHGTTRLPGVPDRFYVQLHRKAVATFHEGLRRAAAVSAYRIERAGGYNYRHMRHDPRMPLSTHAGGHALDIDAKRNFGKTFGVNEDGPEPWTPEWMAIWPDGLPRDFVEAMESVGARWGGRWRAPRGKRGYRDPMHFEL